MYTSRYRESSSDQGSDALMTNRKMTCKNTTTDITASMTAQQ